MGPKISNVGSENEAQDDLKDNDRNTDDDEDDNDDEEENEDEIEAEGKDEAVQPNVIASPTNYSSHVEEKQESPAVILPCLNPTWMDVEFYMRQGMGDELCFTPRGGLSANYNLHDKSDLELIKGILNPAPEGSKWSVMYYPDKHMATNRPNGSFAEGFTPESDCNLLASEKPVGKKPPARKSATKKPAALKSAEKKSSSEKPVGDKPTTKKSAKKKAPAKKAAAEKTKKSQKKRSTEEVQSPYKKDSAAKSGTGKVIVLTNDSDDDSLGFDEDCKGLVEKLSKMRKENKAGKPLIISVSHAFVNVANEHVYYLVIFPKSGNTFYAKAEHYKATCKLAHKKRSLFNPNEDGNWIDTIDFFKARKEEYGQESLWRRTELKQNTTDLMYFVHAAPMGQDDQLASEIQKKVKYFVDVSKKRKTNITGHMALDYALSLPTGEKGGLGRFCLQNKGNGDHEKAAAKMTDELNAHWGNGYSLQYDIHLNKFLVDWDIKKFLTEYVGVNSWDDLDENSKRGCFRDYPKRSLPDWDGIMQESW